MYPIARQYESFERYGGLLTVAGNTGGEPCQHERGQHVWVIEQGKRTVQI